jgi:chemotaxis protein CheX
LDTRNEVIGVFAEAVQVAFREMAATEPVLRDSFVATGSDGLSDVSAVLPVRTTTGAGYLVLSFREQTARVLARRVLVEAAPEPDAVMIHDCVGEVLNVIAGQAKTLLHGTPHHFVLSTPAVGTEIPVLEDDVRRVAVFDSDFGEFTLHAYLPV